MLKSLKFILAILLTLTTITLASINSIAVGSVEPINNKISYHYHCGEEYSLINGSLCVYCTSHTHEMAQMDSKIYKVKCTTKPIFTIGSIPAVMYGFISLLIIQKTTDITYGF